ncbi:MAG: GTP-binding protein [Polaromonas sp.]
MASSATPQRLPLDLVTGFLGTGKTTLINAVLRDPAFAGAMVVVNEFGQVGLDHLLISAAQDNVVLLDSGCLCCAVSGTLRDTLIDLFSRRASGTLPPFNRIIVETSGLANPAPVVASLLGDSALTPRCELSQVLTLVDAATGVQTLARYQEAQRQVAFADRLLISKTDTASLAQVEALAAALAEFNPNVPIGRWKFTDAATPHFGPLAARVPARTAATAGLAPFWLRGPLHPQYGDDGQDAVSGTDMHGGAYKQITTHVLHVPQSITWATYAAWTDALRRRFRNRLLRCKGLLRIEPDGALWVIQGVQGYYAPPQRMVAGVNDSLSGFLVCIGEAITRADLNDSLGLGGVCTLPAGDLSAENFSDN